MVCLPSSGCFCYLKKNKQKQLAKSKRPGGAPTRKNASKGGRKTLAEAVDDEDLKASFDG